jgi:hypothetical protein
LFSIKYEINTFKDEDKDEYKILALNDSDIINHNNNIINLINMKNIKEYKCSYKCKGQIETEINKLIDFFNLHNIRI